MYRNILAASIIFAGSVVPSHGLTQAKDQYFFRFPTSSSTQLQQPPVVDDTQSKDITVTFAGGVDVSFSERLPLRADWEDDNWNVASGTLPDGMSFNPSTMVFSGTPTSAVVGKKVGLVGIDKNANVVAEAEVTFDIYDMVAPQPRVSFYAHTGKYAFDQLSVPAGVTLDGSQIVYAPPPGIEINGRNLDGTPTKAGVYPLLIRALDFDKNVVATYAGQYIVEDAPTFDLIGDDLRSLPNNGNPVGISYNPVPAVRHADDPSKVRYFVETAPGNVLPGSMAISSNPLNRVMAGYVYNHFEQASVRIKALDTDGTTGFSNWFKVGSLGPTPECKLNQPIRIIAKAEVPFSWGPVQLADNRGGRRYNVASGALPEGVTLDPVTGVLSGTPVKEETTQGVTISVDVVNGENVDSTICGPYEFAVEAASFNLTASGPSNVRVGTNFAATLTAGGGLIEPYSITPVDVATLPPGTTFNSATNSVEGAITAAGSYTSLFKLVNGNGYERLASVNVTAHNALSIDAVPDPITVKRYETSPALYQVSFDADTVMPGANAPKVTLNGTLPTGLSYSSSTFSISGGTNFPEGTYGPYAFTLEDGSGDKVISNDFFVDVQPREPMVGVLATLQPFVLNFTDPGQKPFAVDVPEMAQTRPLTYTLHGTLPDGLSFNTTSGMIYGLPTVKGTTSGFTVSVTDGELTETSAPFDVVVDDAPMPDARPIAPVTGNVSGDTVTFMSTSPVSFAGATYEKTLIGGPSSVVFSDYSPKIAGLQLNAATGVISGTPTETFDGSVTISFVDGANRPGEEPVHITVLPYPAVATTAASYDLPRLATAGKYVARPVLVEGFRSSVVYTRSPNSKPWPADVSIAVDGSIQGYTSVSEGVYPGLIVRAKDVASGISVDTAPFAINIIPRQEMTFAPTPTSIEFFISEDGSILDSVSAVLANLLPGGSYVLPLTYSVNDAPLGITVNAENGRFAGWPRTLGTSIVKLTVKDKEGASKDAEITIRARLSGQPQMTPGSQKLLVRQGETFETATQVVSNHVGAVTFESYDDVPPTLNFDPTNGKFYGKIDQPGASVIRVTATDSDTRVTNLNSFAFTVVQPLAILGNPTSITAKQYDVSNAINMNFPAASYAMGKVFYGLAGELPGTLIYKVYADNELSGDVTYYQVHADGGSTPILLKDFPLDALVFDTLQRNLSGVPSKSGSYNFALVAFDEYRDTGYTVDPGDATRSDYNTASLSGYQIDVGAAEPLVALSSASNETLYQYTSQPSLQLGATGGAYGRPVTWTRLSGSFPDGVSPSVLGNNVTFVGYPDEKGSWGNIKYKVTDAAGRSAETSAVTFNVGDRQELLVIASSNPKGMTVNDSDANLTVHAERLAWGDDPKWTVTGTLPPGVTYVDNGDHVKFSGQATVVGTYAGIVVTAVDALNASKSATLTFRVISSTDPITLNVQDIIAKKGFAFSTSPPFSTPVSTDNAYGELVFTSTDKPVEVNMDRATGQLSGTFANAGTVNFNMKVQDETNRLTSKPVKITVLPELRLIVGTQLTFEQGKIASRTVDTSYAIGAVVYRKGAGEWPSGIIVNPNSGAIGGVAAASVKTYSGLTIIGKDSLGDEQSSNLFSIKIDPINANPVIYNVQVPALNVDNAMTDIRPWVQNDVNADHWDFEDDIFTLNQALPAGLNFDDQTGTISGTPSEAWSKSGYVITVTSVLGNADSTAPFTINVAPAADISAVTPQKTLYTPRAGKALTTDKPLFNDTVGTLSFAKVGGSSNLGTLNSDGTLTYTPAPADVGGSFPFVIKVTDILGRTGTFSYNIAPKANLVVGRTDISVGNDVTYSTPFLPTVSGNIGAMSYSYSGLPSGLSYNPATGGITGTVSGTPGDIFNVVLTATDASDSAEVSVPFKINIPTGDLHRYWRLNVKTYSSTGTYSISEMKLLASGVDVTKSATVSWGNTNLSYPVTFAVDGDDQTFTATDVINPSGELARISFDFGLTPQAIDTMWIQKRLNYAYHNPLTWTIDYSDDKVNWVTAWTDGYSAWDRGGPTSYTSVRP